MGNGMAFPLTVELSNERVVPSSRYTLKQRASIEKCVAELTASAGKPSECPRTDKRVKKMWASQTMCWYLFLKSNQILTHAPMWMDFKTVRLIEEEPKGYSYLYEVRRVIK